jgi:hypothetical protein
MRLGAALVTVLIIGWAATSAAAKDGSHRRVAVLEVRSGATGASDLGLRLALILRRTTSLDVVDTEDARRAIGSKVVEELARCSGDLGCVAGVGKRLRCDQVLVVGVSQLGDLIVSLQLVDAKSGKLVARLAESLPEGSEPDDNTLERYLRRLFSKWDFRRYGTIRVDADVTGAEVEIGGIGRGRTPIDPVVVEAPARYDVRVRKAGYDDFTAAIDVPADGVFEVKPRLSKRVTQTTWYGKWWVWAIAGTVLTSAVVTGVVLAEDEPTSGSGIIVW